MSINQKLSKFFKKYTGFLFFLTQTDYPFKEKKKDLIAVFKEKISFQKMDVPLPDTKSNIREIENRRKNYSDYRSKYYEEYTF